MAELGRPFGLNFGDSRDAGLAVLSMNMGPLIRLSIRLHGGDSTLGMSVALLIP